MPGHAVVPVGSQFSEQSPAVAHAPRAVPQPYPYSQTISHKHKELRLLCSCPWGSQDAPGTAGRLQHKARYRHLAQTSMQDLKNGAPGRYWNLTPLNFGAAQEDVESSPDSGPWVYGSSYKRS